MPQEVGGGVDFEGVAHGGDHGPGGGWWVVRHSEEVGVGRGIGVEARVAWKYLVRA